jgi:signal transduction histidine kinase
MEGKGSIDLTLSYVGKNNIAIDIRDTGKGIPKSKVNDVFLPGYTTKKRGWGLGLALAKRIIENYHNGRLFVKWSEVGKGTTFRLLLNQ